ncbi:hypothetical protein AND_003755 [Anopheles darlingi]|uniref:RRM domain-containing protein n=1 Tax=Anopheles darlingi TaxID=43151 RepID=W5JK55_ANODA|nr:hypothetical protein AND_003755 [Anopheles darlingi]
MGDFMNMSLDDIIKQGKKDRKPTPGTAAGLTKTVRKNGGARRFGAAGPSSENNGADWLNKKPKPVADARNKIIQKKRSKIVDARDKLIEKARTGGDARLRLNRKGLVRGADAGVVAGSAPHSRNGVHKGIPHGYRRHHHHQLETVGLPHPPSSSISRGRLMVDPYGVSVAELDPMELDDDGGLAHGGNRRVVTTSPLKRTVLNDSFSMPISMPPPPNFRTGRQPSPPPSASGANWMNDPFECYEPIRRPNLQAAAGLPLPPSQSVRSLAHAHPPYEPSAVRPRSSLRTTTITRRPSSPGLAGVGGLPFDFQPPEMLSSAMRARLQRAPNPNESMGIFAKMPPEEPIEQYKPATYVPSSSYRMHTPASASPPRAGTNEYRIIVSNLHSTVTQQDIQELFEDIGDLQESRLVRPGVAEVVYRTLRDAEQAVDAYHNRQLDGQPMTCLLVHPRSSGKPTASAMKYSSGTTQALAVPMAGRAVSTMSSVATISPSKSSSATSNNIGGSSASGGGTGSTSKPDRAMEIDIDALHSVLFRRNY